jgi:alpha-glucosidase
MKKSTKILKVINYNKYLYVETDGGKFQIYFMTDDIVRFRCTFENKFAPECSYALVKTAWKDQLDKVFKNERVNVIPCAVNPREYKAYWEICTKSLKIRLTKDPFGIEIYDKKGNLLYKDLKERTFLLDDLGRRWHYSVISTHDHFYGFGEKTGFLNKAQQTMKMHQTDTCGYNAKLSDPLYKHIPFYIRFNDITKASLGIFYDNAFDCVFDTGREWSGYWDHYSYYCTDGGDIDMFFINGPQIKDVVRRYTDLTGKSAFPPLGSIGYGHTTMYYTELEKNADDAILKFLDICNKNDIPIDQFQLASGYTAMPDGKRYPFCWNEKKFSDPKRFSSEVAKKGVFITPNVKPGILTSHPHYEEYKNAGAFIADDTGRYPITERYWGGFASFPDFTSQAGREIWKNHMKAALFANGIKAIWDDNCEFDIQNSTATVAGDGIRQGIAGMRPILTNMMAYTAYTAQLEDDANRRPFVVSRAGYAGIQRYAQTWSGDNCTSWDSLKYNIPEMLGMGLSGVANYGSDIGGWFGKCPDPELLVRWFQNGIFQPRFITNSSNTDNTVTEPFMYPRYTMLISSAVKLRYALTPYLYSLLRMAAVNGDPVMRPLVYEFPDDPKCWDESFEFMFGSQILVANVLKKGATKEDIYLPSGVNWFEWQSRKFYQGGQTITLPVTLKSIPMFLKTGSIVPIAQDVTNLNSQVIRALRIIMVGSSTDSSFKVYEDDGKSNNYKKGIYAETTYHVHPGNTTVISVHTDGAYESTISDIELDFVADTVEPFTISLDDQELEKFVDPIEWEQAEQGWEYDLEVRACRIKYKKPLLDYKIRINFDIIDLVKM